MNGQPQHDLLLLGYACIALLGAAICFAILVFVLHVRSARLARHRLRLEAAWEPLLLNALEEPGSAVPDFHLLRRDRLLFVGYLLAFARRVRGPERDVLHRIARPLLPGVAAQLSNSRAEVRARAVQTLAALGLPEYARPVLDALRDESDLVAMTAARGLASRDTPEYAAAVLAYIDRFTLWSPRFLSAMLASIGPDAAPALRAKLADVAATPAARAVAAASLFTLKDFAAADAAAAALVGTLDEELLVAALELLGAVGGAQHVPLVRAAALHPLPWVRAQAMEALAQLGDAGDLDLLEAALDDESPWVALRAGYALGAAAVPERLRALVVEGNSQRGIIAREVLSEAMT